MKTEIKKTEYAVQLVGPGELKLNCEKPVHLPGPYQVLAKVETTGLCFSDLKLLKQFRDHARKGEIDSGIDQEILKEIPSYVPGDLPAVPGHEAVVRIVAVGGKVKHAEVGKRYLIQTDYRWLRTGDSNAAFGYNFEGGLQQFVLMDERVTTTPDGESFLIPASDDLSASAIALVEPWACVEDSYISRERQGLKKGGKLLIFVCQGVDASAVDGYVKVNAVSEKTVHCSSVDKLPDVSAGGYDDIIFAGADPDAMEKVFPLLGVHGLLCIVQSGRSFDRDVVTPVGRVHYGGIRITGTTGSDPAEAYAAIPQTGEIREGDSVDVVGAAGPMGTMHVVRNICQGVKDVSVFAGDMSEERLQMLTDISTPLAERNGVCYTSYVPGSEKAPKVVNYAAIMVPVPAIVANCVRSTAERGIINIFAGIPVHVEHAIDLDSYVRKQLFFIGTSGSVLEDMKIVLAKVESRSLDTNLSVAAVCGLDGAIDGIHAVEERTIPGKIMVYPDCEGLGLTPLSRLQEKLPEVAAKLNNGLWTMEAEKALLARFSN